MSTNNAQIYNDQYKAVNFKMDEAGNLICPQGKRFHFAYRRDIKGNQYGRQEEIYICEDCSVCLYAEQCKRQTKIGASE